MAPGDPLLPVAILRPVRRVSEYSGHSPGDLAGEFSAIADVQVMTSVGRLLSLS